MRVSSSRRSGFAVATVIGLLGVRGSIAAQGDFVNFESGRGGYFWWNYFLGTPDRLRRAFFRNHLAFAPRFAR